MEGLRPDNPYAYPRPMSASRWNSASAQEGMTLKDAVMIAVLPWCLDHSASGGEFAVQMAAGIADSFLTARSQ